MLDSVYVKEKGDTVLIEKYKYLYRDKLVRDTMYISKTDSIQVPYPVEKEFTWWLKIKIAITDFVMVVCILVIIFFVLRLFKKK
jgi:hypothetical protein